MNRPYQPKMNRTILHPGIGVEKSGIEYTRIYHRYYQWIPLVLAIYAVMVFSTLLCVFLTVAWAKMGRINMASKWSQNVLKVPRFH